MNVEQGTITPLVSAVYHKTLAEKIAEKSGEQYGEVINFIRSKISIMTIRSALLCLRGSRGLHGPKTNQQHPDGNDYELYNAELAP